MGYNDATMEKYQYKQSFNVRYCDVDFRDELKPSTALAFLEEAACYSADELGFGYEFIRPRNLAFVVSNVRCEFIRPVKLFEKDVFVRTWPLKPSYVVFGREYQFFSEQDELCVNATSRWCLVDMKTGKLLQAKVIDNQDYSTYNTTKLFEDVRWKLPVFDIGEGELKFTITIANSEYDHYMHVNNTRYADYCFNAFTVEELQKAKLKSFAISYVRQCREGDELRFYRKYEKGAYYVQGVNQSGEIVVQSEIVFIP